jgi:hypothetical protein
MGFTIKKGGNFTLAPAGTHPARCYIVVDEGHQPTEYMGQKKAPRHRIRIGFELPFNKHIFDEKRGEEPFTLSREFTASFHEKAGLKPVLNAWRGRPLEELEIYGGKDPNGKEVPPFDFAKLLGAPALITVVHEKRSDGGMVAKIASIAKLPAEMAGVKIQLPPAVLKPILFSVDAGPNDPGFAALPEWIQEICQRCEEWTSAPNVDPPDEGQPVGDGAASPSGTDEPF